MEETRIFPRPTPRGPPNALLIETILTLRFVQQSLLVTTLFIAFYFAYWHVVLVDAIPGGLIVVIGATAAILTLSHGGTLLHALFPESFAILPLKSTLAQLVLMIIGLIGLRSVGYIGAGEADDWFKPIRENNGYASLKPAGVEEHHAVLGRCVLWLAGGGLAMTLILSGTAIWKASKTGKLTGFSLLGRTRSRGDYVAVGEVAYEFDEEETICDEGSVKSN